MPAVPRTSRISPVNNEQVLYALLWSMCDAWEGGDAADLGGSGGHINGEYLRGVMEHTLRTLMFLFPWPIGVGLSDAMETLSKDTIDILTLVCEQNLNADTATPALYARWVEKFFTNLG